MIGLTNSLVLLACTAATLFASVVPESRALNNYNPNSNLPNLGSDSNTSPKPRQLDPNGSRTSTVGGRLTNGERFARGLPPSKPKRLYTPTRRQSVPSVSPSGVGIIQVTDANSGDLVGYVADAANSGSGEYGITQDTTLALQVQTTYQDSPTGNIITLNGFSQPYFGAEQGYYSGSDIGVGSANYAYLCGIETATAPNSGPQAGDDNSFSDAYEISAGTAETAIWAVDPTSLIITAQYVNSDVSKPATLIVFGNVDGNFVLTGDFTAYNASYYPAELVTFTLV